jgi:Asp-tRNA(Asn)/Glu-tRNA(Gln) amidotransferase A subunit family amidase
MNRQPDPLWDALTEVFPTDDVMTRNERARWNVAVKQLREAGATPDEIRRRAHAYQRAHPTWAYTPLALVSHWSEFARRKPKPLNVIPDEPPPDPPRLTKAEARRVLATSEIGRHLLERGLLAD